MTAQPIAARHGEHGHAIALRVLEALTPARLCANSMTHTAWPRSDVGPDGSARELVTHALAQQVQP
jgi:hypothetical protein